MESIFFAIKGIVAFIMHNGRTANPLDPWAKTLKQLTNIKKKTDDIYAQLSDLEFLAGLYTDPIIVPGGDMTAARVIVPDYHIEACLLRGARKIKKGKQFESGCFVCGSVPMDFPHKNMNPTQLLTKDEYRLVATVNVNGSKVVRTRPIFHEWGLKFQVQFNEDIITRGELIQSVEYAGEQCGMGSWRPKHGRFEAIVVNA